MGELLQIRVMAQTFDEGLVEKRWRRLWGLAWPEHVPEGLPRGVLELTLTLADRLRLGMLDPRLAELLGPGIEKAERARLAIEDALAGRRPAEADRVTYDLEDLLDDLERRAPKP